MAKDTTVVTTTQLSAEQLAARFAAARELYFQRGYIPCSVEGCRGLVSPAFIRKDSTGEMWGLCPNAGRHARLMPGLFEQPRPFVRAPRTPVRPITA